MSGRLGRGLTPSNVQPWDPNLTLLQGKSTVAHTRSVKAAVRVTGGQKGHRTCGNYNYPPVKILSLDLNRTRF